MRGWLGMGLAASQPTMVQQNSCSKYELFKAAVNCHLHFVKREFSKHKFSSNLIVAVYVLKSKDQIPGLLFSFFGFGNIFDFPFPYISSTLLKAVIIIIYFSFAFSD